MKRTVIIALATASLALVHPGSPVCAAENLKIGMVNFQQALNEVEQGKRAKAALKSEFDSKQKKLDLQQEELKRLQEGFNKDKAVLSQEAMASKQKAFSEKYLELQKSMQSYREDLVQREAKMTSQILQNLKKVVAEIGQKEGFTLIVETSQDAVLYAQAKEDLSGRVITTYNQRYTGALKTE